MCFIHQKAFLPVEKRLGAKVGNCDGVPEGLCASHRQHDLASRMVDREHVSRGQRSVPSLSGREGYHLHLARRKACARTGLQVAQNTAAAVKNVYQAKKWPNQATVYLV